MSGKSLADGTAATSATAIYTVPANKSNATITYLGMFNTNATQQIVGVYLKRYGQVSSRQIRRFVLDQNQHAEAFRTDIQPTLSPGDSILLGTTTASALDYFLSGEET